MEATPKGADLYLDENAVMAIRGVWPDLTEQAASHLWSN